MHAERFKSKKGDVQDEMEADARRNQFDPLTDYLQGSSGTAPSASTLADPLHRRAGGRITRASSAASR
jgi:hypothetical protein